jgi:stage V sporulation protein G
LEILVEYLKLFSLRKNEKVVNMMEVTDVRLRRVNTDGRMRAIASITLDNEFVVHDIRVIDGNNGLFVAMPSKRTPDGEFRDIAHPINSGTRGKIQEAVLVEYHRLGELEVEFEEAGAS